MKRRHFLGASLTLPIFSQIHAAKAVDKKPTIVLVHGAWHGGWCWKKVTNQLRADGFEVFAPTLTGLGERVHLLNYDINLDTHIQDIMAVLEYEDLKDVILVGHSYGGMVITGVADKAKDRISQLVYLDAFLPENGKALADYVQLPPFKKDANGKYELWKIPSFAKAEQFGVVDKKDVEWVNAKLGVQPIQTFMQPISLSETLSSTIKKTYIKGSDKQSKHFGEAAVRAKSKGYKYVELQTGGHDIMVSEPETLVKILKSLV
jgi:pimeloyl-ACP methyl ester carboxylesterase